MLWLVLGGLLVSLGHFFAGLLYCVTIIGISFGFQHFKMALLPLTPF
ncbi:MAG TPA: hypothetical protein DD383_07095 [Rikenellaceae bacterium]|nr:hypothetical protein [Rikenellaceae bacterium]